VEDADIKPIGMLLLRNYGYYAVHLISYRFEVIADCCLNLDSLRSRAPFGEGAGLRVNVYYSS